MQEDSTLSSDTQRDLNSCFYLLVALKQKILIFSGLKKKKYISTL